MERNWTRGCAGKYKQSKKHLDAKVGQVENIEQKIVP